MGTIPNLFRLSFLLPVALASVNQGLAQCVVPPSGLISWWPGDGNAMDIQGSNHGTLQNGATFAPGLTGQAFSFDGVDDYFDYGSQASLNFGAGAGFSFDGWVKTTDMFGPIVVQRQSGFCSIWFCSSCSRLI